MNGLTILFILLAVFVVPPLIFKDVVTATYVTAVILLVLFGVGLVSWYNKNRR